MIFYLNFSFSLIVLYFKKYRTIVSQPLTSVNKAECHLQMERMGDCKFFISSAANDH